MQKTARVLLIVALFVIMALAVSPAFANHLSNPIGISCDAAADRVTVTIEVFGGGVGNYTGQDVFVNGAYVGTLDFGYGIPDGTYTRWLGVAGLNPSDNVVVADYDTSISCGLPSGPPRPEGFELHWIVCDTAVFDTPGGSPVGSDAVTNGQTWFVNPEPVDAPDGSSWTEIWTGGYQNPYIPTSCVGGPA
jgi:hypothetical protein